MELTILDNQAKFIGKLNIVLVLLLVGVIVYVATVENSMIARVVIVALGAVLFLLNRYKHLLVKKVRAKINDGSIFIGDKKYDLSSGVYQTKIILQGWKGEESFQQRKSMKATGFGNLIEITCQGKIERYFFFLASPMEEKLLIEELASLEVEIQRSF